MEEAVEAKPFCLTSYSHLRSLFCCHDVLVVMCLEQKIE